MGRYLELVQQVIHSEPGGVVEALQEVSVQGYDKNDRNDKRSDQQFPTHTEYTPLGQVAAKSKLPPPTLNDEDWRSFYEERAAILEHDGGLDREKAERLAYEASVAGVANAMTTDYPQDRCAACGTHLSPSAGLPLADHAVVCDGKCHDDHRRQQRERAEWQLTEWGITASVSS